MIRHFLLKNHFKEEKFISNLFVLCSLVILNKKQTVYIIPVLYYAFNQHRISWFFVASLTVDVCVLKIELNWLWQIKYALNTKYVPTHFKSLTFCRFFFFFISISWSVFIFSLRTKVRVWLILWLCASIGLTWKMSLEMKEIYILRKKNRCLWILMPMLTSQPKIAFLQIESDWNALHCERWHELNFNFAFERISNSQNKTEKPHKIDHFNLRSVVSYTHTHTRLIWSNWNLSTSLSAHLSVIGHWLNNEY